MDANTLLECFAGTLEAAPDVRGRAEQQLQQQAATPGFLGACLDIIATREVPLGIRQAAAVYFKNRVVRHWTHGRAPVDAGEKPVVAERLVRVMAAVDAATQAQLLPVFRTLVAAEYPRRWPGVLAEVCGLLECGADAGAVLTGAMCFAEICRHYRWTENREREAELDPLVAQVFPHLLRVGDAAVDLAVSLAASEPAAAERAAGIVTYVLKAYKFVTYFDLPRVLQLREAAEAWGAFHCRVLAAPVPAPLVHLAPGAERLQTMHARSTKWAVANVARLFRRYALRDLSLKRAAAGFREAFVEAVLPHVMRQYLDVVACWRRGERWLADATVYHLLDFFSHCATQKEAWLLLAPCYERLVAQIVVPVLCPTPETLELFEDDPADYIHLKLDNFDDLAPDVAALGLVATLVLRRKATVAPIVELAVARLTELKAAPTAHDVETARQTDGALRLVGGIAHVLTAKSLPYLPQMEQFLAELVVPRLDSPHAFLQARALDVCLKLADLQLLDAQTMDALYLRILRAFAGGEAVCLPVALQSALAVQAYLPQTPFRDLLGSMILPTMARLLELLNEIDSEAVAVVMQECVECFAQQLQPFAMDLTRSLVAQFLRLAAEINDATASDELDFDADAGDALSDKITAALGLLNTIVTVLLSFENSRDACLQLEAAFSPAVEYVLVHQMDDFLAEAGELIENAIFLVRDVSPLMWTHLPRLLDLFLQGVALMYAEDLAPCLRNYIVFGASYFALHQDLSAKFVLLIALIVSNEDDPDYSEVTLACDLGLTMVLALQHDSPLVIAELSKVIVPVLAQFQLDGHIRQDALRANAINYVVACLMYDCPATLAVLLENLYLQAFFEMWLAWAPEPKRVFDVKLSILGLMRIANSPDVAAAVPLITAHVGTCLAALFRELPKALQNLEKQRTEFSKPDFYDDATFGGEFGDFDDNFNSDSDDDDDPADGATDKYREFLDLETKKLMGSAFDNEDQILEDVLGATPLDNVDPTVVFREFSSSLQENNAALYAAIFENISESDRQVFVDVYKTT